MINASHIVRSNKTVFWSSVSWYLQKHKQMIGYDNEYSYAKIQKHKQRINSRSMQAWNDYTKQCSAGKPSGQLPKFPQSYREIITQKMDNCLPNLTNSCISIKYVSGSRLMVQQRM